MKYRSELSHMPRGALIKYGKLFGMEFPDGMSLTKIRDMLYNIELPQHSDDGIMKIALKIKYESDLGRGTSGVVDFLKTVYPTIEHEEARQKARAM